jgi:hypothetical protein
VCRHVCRHMCCHICVDICVNMCIAMCVDMCIGMRAAMCVDMCDCSDVHTGHSCVQDQHKSFDALHFVLLLPHGDDGWCWDPEENADVNSASLLKWYRYRLHERRDTHGQLLNESLFCAHRLFQEYTCMAFARVENIRLDYLRHNQKKLRTGTCMDLAYCLLS